MPDPVRRPLHTDRPDLTAALRGAAWTYAHTGQAFTPKEIQSQVQRARLGMGLPPLQGGAGSDQVQCRTQGTQLFKQHDRPLHYEPQDGRLVPTQQVRNDWRFLAAADHADVRLTARQGHLKLLKPGVFRFAPRGSHLPTLTLLAGSVQDVPGLVKQNQAERPGLYLLRRGNQNYAGRTQEPGTRLRRHGATGADHVLFACPEEALPVGGDSLGVAEALALASLGELLTLANIKRGNDQLPQPLALREGAGLALAFVAAMIRWGHDHPTGAGAFLCWRTDMRDLAPAYLSLNTPGEQG